MSNVKKLSCIHCGHPFDAYPPDDVHDYATRSMENFERFIEINYTCENCKKNNKIYWADRLSAVEKAKSVLESLAEG